MSWMERSFSHLHKKLGAFELNAPAKSGEGTISKFWPLEIFPTQHVTNRPYKFDLCNVICLKNGQIFGLGFPSDFRGALISSAPSFTIYTHICIDICMYVCSQKYICAHTNFDILVASV